MELTPIEKKLFEALEETLKGKPYFHITPQYRILDYRVDFMVWIVWKDKVGNLHLIKMVIECDGHDFHEKTKYQVARDKKRDRDIQRLGFRVLRFSGSEIHNNSIGCVKNIIEQMESECRA